MRSLLILFTLSFLTGCISTEVTTLRQSSYTPVHPDAVVIYRSADDIKGKYEELALITTEGDANWTKESKMLEKAREKAGNLGANGLVLDAMHEPGDGAKIAGALLGTNADRRGKMVAIRVLENEDN